MVLKLMEVKRMGHLEIPCLNSTGAEDGEAGEKDEGNSGGLITSFINLVSPKSTKSGEFAKRKVEDEVEAGEIVNGKTCTAEQAGKHGGGSRGISNIISSFFSPSEEGGKEAEKVKDAGNKRLKVDEEEEEGTGGAGGIIDNIVSHLPKSLPDDAAPTTDEASILIHSLVKD